MTNKKRHNERATICGRPTYWEVEELKDHFFLASPLLAFQQLTLQSNLLRVCDVFQWLSFTLSSGSHTQRYTGHEMEVVITHLTDWHCGFNIQKSSQEHEHWEIASAALRLTKLISEYDYRYKCHVTYCLTLSPFFLFTAPSANVTVGRKYVTYVPNQSNKNTTVTYLWLCLSA